MVQAKSLSRSLCLRHPRSVIGLFVVANSCAVFAAAANAKEVVATALFQVSSERPSLLTAEGVRSSRVRNYEIFRKTQLALLKSHYVLATAVRDANVQSLSMIKSKEEPVAWLQDNLHVEFRDDSEILAVSLRGPQEQSEQLRELVDAVAKAYREEVIYEDKQRRLATRDLLARNLDNLNKEIRRRHEEFVDISREAGHIKDGAGRVLQQLDMKRVDRIDAELIRLEEMQLREAAAPDGSPAWLEQRIIQLRERQAELERKIAARAAQSFLLTARERELNRLERLVNEMSMRLEKMDVEAAAPERIRQLQAAIVAPAD